MVGMCGKVADELARIIALLRRRPAGADYWQWLKFPDLPIRHAPHSPQD
jgi:hypothetical protein